MTGKQQSVKKAIKEKVKIYVCSFFYDFDGDLEETERLGFGCCVVETAAYISLTRKIRSPS